MHHWLDAQATGAYTFMPKATLAPSALNAGRLWVSLATESTAAWVVSELIEEMV